MYFKLVYKLILNKQMGWCIFQLNQIILRDDFQKE